MHLPSSLRRYLLLPAFVLLATAIAAPRAFAGAPVLDAGNQPDVTSNDFYSNAQSIPGNITVSHAVYGKLEGTTPIDVYSFVPDQDATVQLSLYIRQDEVTSTTNPYLVLVDPTTNTEAQDLGVPLPTTSTSYHTSVITQVPLTTPQTYTEPILMETYDVAAQQSVALSKGKTYYFIILDSDHTGAHITHYAVGFGLSKAWTAKDFFTSFGSWFRLRVDSYGASSPFHFGASIIGYFVLLLGLIALLGAWMLYHLFNLLSTKSKTAAYLFVKLQNFLPISMWVGLGLVAVGGYIYAARHSWAGLSFVLGLVFIPTLIAILIDTLVLSPQVKQVELSRKEASIPLTLRKKLFVAFVIEFLLLVAFLVFLSMRVGA